MGAERVVSDAWKNWLPTVTASFTPRYVTPAGLFEPSKSWRAFFSLEVPIFDGTLRPQKRAYEADREAARLRLDARANEARSEVRIAQEAVKRTERIVTAVGQAAENGREALRITEIAYRAGAPPTSRWSRPSRPPARPRSRRRSPRTGSGRHASISWSRWASSPSQRGSAQLPLSVRLRNLAF